MLVLRTLRARRHRAAARPTDVDRRRPSRRLVLLPAVAGRGPDRRRLAARGRGAHRACRDRGGRRRVVARRDRSAARSPGVVAGLVMAARPPQSTSRRSSGTRTSSRCRARSPSPARGRRGPAATVAGGSSPRSGRRSRCNATSSASRCCPSSLRRSSLDARRRPLGGVSDRRSLAIVAHRLPAACRSMSSRRASPRREPRPRTSRRGRSRSGRRAPDPLRDRDASGPQLAADRTHHRRLRRRVARDRRCHRHRGLAMAVRATRRSASSSAGSGWDCCGRSRSSRSPRPASPPSSAGLPNDHYHAFADPMVFVLVGLGAAALVREVRAPIGPARGRGRRRGAARLEPDPSASRRSIPTAGFPAGEPRRRRVDGALESHGVERTQATCDPLAARLQVDRGAGLPARAARSRLRRRPAEGRGAPGGGAARPPMPLAGVVLCATSCSATRSARDCGGPAEDAGPQRRPVTAPRSRCSTASRPHPAAGCRSTRRGAGADRAGYANAGAPDAGVRCPRDPDGGGRSGSCPGML